MNKLEKLLLPREKSIIREFRCSVPVEVLPKLDRQLEAIGVVQREVGGYDVNFYSKRLFRAKPLDCEPFRGMGDEVNVAIFWPKNDSKSSVKVKIWFVRGKIFSIEFEGQPLPKEDFTEWHCDILNPLSD